MAALEADGEARALRPPGRARDRARAAASASRPRTPRRAAHPTRTRRPGMGVPTSTGSGRSAASTTRPRSTSRSPRSCRGRRSLAGSCSAIGARPRGGRLATPTAAERRQAGDRRSAATRLSGGPWEARAGYSRAIAVGDACSCLGTTDAGPDGRVAPSRATPPARPARRWRSSRARSRGRVRARGRRADADVHHRPRPTRDAVAAVHGEVFGDVRPAATLVVVARLDRPSLLVEIEADAVRGIGQGRQRGARSRPRRAGTPTTRPEQQVPAPQPRWRCTATTPTPRPRRGTAACPAASSSTNVFDGGERGQHRRSHEPEVEQDARRQALDPGREQRDRSGWVRREAAMSNASATRATLTEALPVGSARSIGSAGARRRSAGVIARPGIVDRARARPSPTSGPTSPPATTPTAGPRPATARPRAGRRHPPRPARGARSTRPTARPAIAAGKTTSSPSVAGFGIAPPRNTPASVARFHGMNAPSTAAIQYPRDVGAPDPEEMRDRERERLVGEDVGHRRRGWRAAGPGPAARATPCTGRGGR